VWVGVNNLEAGRHVADTVLSALRRAGRPPEESRIGVVIDEVRLTSQSQRWLAIRDTMRTAGIHDEGPHPRLMFGAARIGAGSADDMDPNYWGLAERIDSILAERPDVLLCGSSSVARTAHAAARERCPRSASPVIVSLDGAIEDRMLGWERPVAFLRYRPRELVDKVFEILGNWSAYKERGQQITLDVSMHGTSVLEQAIAALPAASESFQVGQLMESSGQPRSVCRRRSPLSGSARATRRRRGLARVHDRGAPI
jgi:DNA-binding LacI/PurR family transcriptional regulator